MGARKPLASPRPRRARAAKTPAAKRQAPATRPRGRKRKGPAERALERELDGDLAPVAGSALAASALALARQLDKPRISATATASCSRALLDTLERLRGLVPQKEEEGPLDDLQGRRAARLGRSREW